MPPPGTSTECTSTWRAGTALIRPLRERALESSRRGAVAAVRGSEPRRAREESQQERRGREHALLGAGVTLGCDRAVQVLHCPRVHGLADARLLQLGGEQQVELLIHLLVTDQADEVALELGNRGQAAFE